jgi:hypothetical protein
MRRLPRAWVGLCIGTVLALGSEQAGATALGGLATSAGMLVALVALMVLKGWPAHASAMSTGGLALLLAGVAAWWWQARAAGVRVAAFDAWAPAPTDLASLGNRPPAADRARDDLLADLRAHFVQLQQAWDRGDAQALGGLTTPEMLAELRAERSGCASVCSTAQTEVVVLNARLLGLESLAQGTLASVEFSGLIRESAESGATPFRELWMLTRSKHEHSGWKLARHQALF